MEPPAKRQRRDGPLNIKVEVPEIGYTFGMPVDDHYEHENNGVRIGTKTVYKSIWFPDDSACQAHAVRLRSLSSIGPGVPHVLYMQRRGSNLIYVQSKIANAQSPAKWSMSRHQSECLCDQIATILERAHRLGLYHRDIKPSNILVTKTNKAYLIDWDHQDDSAGDLTWSEDAGADQEAVADLKELRANSADFDLGTLAMLRDYWLPTCTTPSYIG